MTKNKENKTIQIHLRVTPDEYNSIKKRAAETGLNMSEFSRRILIGEKVITAPPADFFVLIKEVKRVGSNLNQLIRKLNVLGIAHSMEIERCIRDIQETKNMLYKTFTPGKGD